MGDFLNSLYPWIKAFHIIAVIAWMAGMLYLPRLYVYHCEVAPTSPESERFKIMERRLLRIIVNPSMIAVWLLGITLAFTPASGGWHQGWLEAKLILVVAMTTLHGFFARWRKDFARDQNHHSQRFYRLMNEVPVGLMAIIVILAVVKPF
jgi:protoporphyrinogen IX oxidase